MAQTLRDPHKSTPGSAPDEDKWGQATFRKHSKNVVHPRSHSLQKHANNPSATQFMDARTGHINVIQEVEGKLIRIIVPRDKMKIISVRPIKFNQVKSY
ncbi:hypothetical protein [Pseudomonas retamae]|uniref:Uncharacterized protein n=1 Tax=Pseudomonas retamae TaxID=702110 RepID=A0ABW7DKZ3_9PSED